MGQFELLVMAAYLRGKVDGLKQAELVIQHNTVEGASMLGLASEAGERPKRGRHTNGRPVSARDGMRNGIRREV